MTAFTQVTACAVLDVDSQPNNNTTNVPVEDDEAAVTVSTAAPAVPFAQQNATQLVPIAIHKLYPSVTDGDLAIEFNSIVEREVRFEFYNSGGFLMQSELRKVEKGEQTLNFDVWHLPQGTYIIHVSSNKLRHSPMKFVKL